MEMNDRDRRVWVLNDEGLYLWWQASRQSLTAFIRDHRQDLTEYINRALGNKENRL
jgi:hypothetical protein